MTSDSPSPVRASAQEQERLADIQAQAKAGCGVHSLATVQFLLDLLAAEARGRKQAEQALSASERFRAIDAAHHIDREVELQQQVAALTQALKTVVETFRRDEAQGYRSRDRQFAIEILDAALTGAQA